MSNLQARLTAINKMVSKWEAEHPEPIQETANKDFVELRLKGKFKDNADGLIELLKRSGMDYLGCGLYPDGSKWYRFMPVKFGEL